MLLFVLRMLLDWMAQQLQRQRARKARDNFLKMLAENTEIDHRTTWREAVRILADESRFTAVEDEREREEIYNDFVFELAKKEKQVCLNLSSLKTTVIPTHNVA